MPVSFATPTVLISDGAGGQIRINASDYDEAAHELWEPEAAEAQPESAEPVQLGLVELKGFDLDELPVGPAAKESLRTAGLGTALAIVAAADKDPEWFGSLDRIGPRVAETILGIAKTFVKE